MGKGLEPIEDCPQKLITDDIALVFDTADLLDAHAGWPNGKGWLDEGDMLVKCVRYAQKLRAADRARRMRHSF